MSEASAGLILRTGFEKDVGLAAGKVKAAARQEDVELVEGALGLVHALRVAARDRSQIEKECLATFLFAEQAFAFLL